MELDDGTSRQAQFAALPKSAAPICRGKVLTAIWAVAVFAAGVIASPALADLYEWAKDAALGQTLRETEVRQLDVVAYDGTLREGYTVEEKVPG